MTISLVSRETELGLRLDQRRPSGYSPEGCWF
jgi:hypothetical protein